VALAPHTYRVIATGDRIDTNVLVRYLRRTIEPISQGNQTIEDALRHVNQGSGKFVAMVETAWVPTGLCLTDEEIAAAIELVLQADMLVSKANTIFTSMVPLGGIGFVPDTLIMNSVPGGLFVYGHVRPKGIAGSRFRRL